MKRWILLVFFFLSAFLSSATAEDAGHSLVQYSIPKTDMKIMIPSSWKKGGVSGESVLASFKPGKGLYPNLNITLEDHGNKSLEEVFNGWIKLLQSPLVHKQQLAENNGMRVHFSQVEWDSMLGHLGAFRILTKVKDKILSITYVDKTSGMTRENMQMYVKSMNSLKISK
jgi:hypothetical protein